MNALKSIKWNSLLNALIFFALGLLLLIFPIESLSIGGYLLASIFMLVGIGSFIRIIQNKGIETSADIFYIIFGIALIAVSISIFIDPTWIIRLINVHNNNNALSSTKTICPNEPSPICVFIL